MPKAILQKGTIVPLEPLPPEWDEGTVLDVTNSEAGEMDIDAWAEMMNRLCADSRPDDEAALREVIEEQRRRSKEQVRRQMGLSA
jgi:hypothetical protein